MWFSLILALSLNLSSAVLPLANQEKAEKAPPPREHHEVVVTATRLEIPPRQVASSITLLTAESLARGKKSTLVEVLEGVASVSVTQSGGPGGASSVFIRGANSEHTLFLIDGVELNDPMNPSRSFDLAHLTLQNVDRVEVLRGPQSPLYGSDALGGVINVITRQGSDEPTVSLTSSAGSYGTMTSRGEITGSAKGVRFSLGLQHWATKGVSAASSFYHGNSEPDGTRNLSLSARLSYSPIKNVEVDFIARSTLARVDIDNFGGSYGDDPNHIQDYRHFLYRAQVRSLTLKNRWEQKLSLALVSSRRNYDNPADEMHPQESEAGHFESRSLKLDWQNNLFLHPSHTLTLGLEREQEGGQSDYVMRAAWGEYRSDFPHQKAATTGFYIQDYFRSLDRFFVTFGFRFDHHSRGEDAFTYRLAPAYIWPRMGTKLKGSVGTGFKSPSLYQLYAPGTFYGPIGNPHLKPEKCSGWDIGVEQPIANERVQLRLALAYFQNQFKDLISYDVSRGYVNIGQAESRGVEAEAELRSDKGFSMNVAYIRMEARDKTKNEELLRRPKERFCVALGYSMHNRWSFSFSFHYTGKRRDIDYSGWLAREVILRGYGLLNGVISCAPRPKVELFIKLDNILNTRYETIYGYGTLGFSAQAGVTFKII